MKFTEEKKQAVLRYILEKISQQDPRITKTVSETMDINQNTVHSYISELIDQGVIRRVKRGQYELVRKQYKFCLERSKGDLDSDLYAYQKYLAPIIQDEPKNVQGIWAYAFTEMINNVMDHSLASEVHIRIDRDPVNTSVIISDNGVGIFHKLQEHFGVPTAEEATVTSSSYDYFVKLENGEEKFFGPYDTTDELLAAVESFCNDQVKLGNMDQSEAREIVSQCVQN